MPQVADSAGIRVIRHPPVDVTLRVSSQPDVVAGDDAETALFGVRGGVLLEEGFAVANGGSEQVFLFSSSGDLEAIVGREGRGPREFANLLWIQAQESGGLLAYDAGNLRLVRISASGEFLDTWPVPFDEQPDVPEGAIVGRGFGLGVAPGDQVLMIPWAVAMLDGVDGPLPVRGIVKRYARDGRTAVALDSVQLRTWHEAARSDGPPIDQVFGSPVFVSSANRSVAAYSDAAAPRMVVLEEGRVGYVVEEDRDPEPFRPGAFDVSRTDW